MRLLQLLVVAMSSFTTPQAVAPRPEPPTITAPAQSEPEKPSHVFSTPLGRRIEVDDDVCDVLIGPDHPPLFFFLAPDGEFSVSEGNCALAVRKWMFSRTVLLPRA